jgi:hypothetical protein
MLNTKDKIFIKMLLIDALSRGDEISPEYIEPAASYIIVDSANIFEKEGRGSSYSDKLVYSALELCLCREGLIQTATFLRERVRKEPNRIFENA